MSYKYNISIVGLDLLFFYIYYMLSNKYLSLKYVLKEKFGILASSKCDLKHVPNTIFDCHNKEKRSDVIYCKKYFSHCLVNVNLCFCNFYICDIIMLGRQRRFITTPYWVLNVIFNTECKFIHSCTLVNIINHLTYKYRQYVFITCIIMAL